MNHLSTFRQFMGTPQLNFMLQAMKGEEGSYFRAKFMELGAQFATMPKTYEQDGAGMKAIAHLHYFTAGADWYITEKDMGDGSDDLAQHQAFGVANFGYGAELGYISIAELIENGAELDLHFAPVALETLAKVQS